MPSIRQNLLAVRAAVEAHPESEFDLSAFHCGTQYCSAGLAAGLPEMQAQGLHFVQKDNFLKDYPTVRIHGFNFHYVCDAMFGHYSWADVFSTREDEEQVSGVKSELSDKQIALDRLNLQLTMYPKAKEHLPSHQADTSFEHLFLCAARY